MKFIHISDLHFHGTDEKNSEVTKTLGNLNKNYSSHCIIVTGDIVDDGNKEQYILAFEALQHFKKRIFICPGNHDFGTAGNFYERKKAESFDEYLMTPLQQNGTFSDDNLPVVSIIRENNDHVMLIALDTNLETMDPTDFACGNVGDKQLKALKDILSDSSNATFTKILFFHHHPFIRSDFTMELKDASKLMEVIKNKVNVVLFGHKHDSDMWRSKYGIEFILASNNSPGKGSAREITIENKNITVNEVPID